MTSLLASAVDAEAGRESRIRSLVESLGDARSRHAATHATILDARAEAKIYRAELLALEGVLYGSGSDAESKARRVAAANRISPVLTDVQ